jgi:hypothetical protein
LQNKLELTEIKPFMIVKDISAEPVKKFTPKTLSITFQTQDELDAFGALCNCPRARNAMRENGGEMPHFKTLKDMGADIEKYFPSVNRALVHYLNDY